MNLRLDPSRGRFLLMLACLAVVGARPAVAQGEPVVESGEPADAAALLNHAKTYYWLGLGERGDPRAYERGLAYARMARLATGEGSADLLHQVEAVESDLEQQVEICHVRFACAFPVARLLGRTFFVSEEASGTFDLLEVPRVVAVRSAVRQVRDEVLRRWVTRAQLSAVVVAIPSDPEMENEALYELNRSQQMFITSGAELAAVPEPLRGALRSGRLLSPGERQSLLRALATTQVLVVTLRVLDEVNETAFVLAEGRVYDTNAGSGEPQSLSMFGLSQGRHGMVVPLLLLTLLLLGLGLAVVSAHTRGATDWGWGRRLGVGAIAFALGRTLPWALIPVLHEIGPEPETLRALSVWWPAAVSLAVVVLPLLAYQLLASRFQALAGWLALGEHAPSAFVAAGLGASAYLSVSLLLYLEAAAWPIVASVVLGAMATGWVLGHVLSGLVRWPKWVGVWAVAGAAAFGLAALHGSPVLTALSTAAALLAVPVGSHVSARRSRQIGARGPAIVEHAGSSPADVQEFLDRTAHPPFVPGVAYRAIVDHLAALEVGKTVQIFLSGPAGRGKSATARAAICAVRGRLATDGKPLREAEAECPEPSGKPAPYGPLRHVLASLLGVDVLGDEEKALEHIPLALDGLFREVVPFAGLLFPESGGEHGGAASSRSELFAGVRRAVEHLLRRGPVLVFVDDVHWIDDASRDLLEFLLREFPEGGSGALALVLASRNAEDAARFGMAATAVDLPEPKTADRVELLERALGLRADVARAIVQRVSQVGDAGGELHWVFHTAAHLARIPAFARDAETGAWGWAPDFRDRDMLPVPDGVYSVFAARLGELGRHRAVLECAACVGPRFSVTVLARCLDRPRLQLLEELRDIEMETGIIADDREADDWFVFASPFMLEVVRRELLISAKGPLATDVPQLIREYHARIAGVLVQAGEAAPGGVFEIARQCYAGGASTAAQGLVWGAKAAAAAAGTFDFKSAHAYVAMADECARIGGGVYDAEWEHLHVDLDQAFVENVGVAEVAVRGLAFIGSRPSTGPQQRLLVARVAASAARQGAPEMVRQEAEATAAALLAGAGGPRERAEALLVLAAALPRSPAVAAERQARLQEALALVDGAAETDVPSQTVLAQVCNELAGELTSGLAKNPARARELFLRSVAIKSRPAVGDRPGLARSFGGLGRLALYAEHPEYEEALHWFDEDLRVSRDIGDRGGEAMMQSLVGQCALKLGRVADAEAAYRESLRLASNVMGRQFAAAGLIESLATLGRQDELTAFGESTLAWSGELLRTGFAADALRDALTRHVPAGSQWAAALLGLLPEAPKEEN